MKQEEMLLTSRPKPVPVIFLLLSGAGITALGYSFVMRALAPAYPQIPELLLASFFCFIGILCLAFLLRFDILILDTEKLLVKSVLGYQKKVIYLSEITGYSEIEKDQKYTRRKELSIFTSGASYTISSYTHANYTAIRSRLTKGRRRNTPYEAQWRYKTNRNVGIGFILLGLLALGLLFSNYTSDRHPLSSQQLTTVKGTLLNEIKVEEGRRGARSIEIRISEFPNFRFKLSGNGFYAAHTEQLLENVRPGHSIEVSMLTEAYEKKLAKTVPLSFWDKGFNYSFITVYGLSDSRQSYLALQEYNKASSENADPWGIWILTAMSLLVIATGAFLLYKNKRPA